MGMLKCFFKIFLILVDFSVINNFINNVDDLSFNNVDDFSGFKFY